MNVGLNAYNWNINFLSYGIITEPHVFDDTGGTVCLHIEQKICSRAAFKVRMFQLFQAQVQLGLLGTVVNSESSELRAYDFQVFQEMAIWT